MNNRQYYVNKIIELENEHHQMIELAFRLPVAKVELLIGSSSYVLDKESIEVLEEFFEKKAYDLNKKLEQLKEEFAKQIVEEI